MVAEVTIFVNNPAKQNPQTCMTTPMLGHFFSQIDNTTYNIEL